VPDNMSTTIVITLITYAVTLGITWGKTITWIKGELKKTAAEIERINQAFRDIHPHEVTAAIDQLREYLDNDNKRIASMRNYQAIMLKSILLSLDHIEHGNGKDKVRETREMLQQNVVEIMAHGI